MAELEDSLRQLANGAGYFFQERLREEVAQTSSQHGWRVAAEEHRWCNDNGLEGFIDLILERGSLRIVIEAKKTREANWLFLVPRTINRSLSLARCLWTVRNSGEPPRAAWMNVRVSPPSPEAKFCVVRGQGERDQPMLERLGGILLRSLEALAEEELRLGSPSLYGGDQRSYFPMIVTNSQMYACYYDPEKIDLRSGELPEGDFEPIHFVRFRKGLSTAMSVPSETASLGEANREKERTIFIVEGSRIGEVLKGWEMY